MLSREASFAIRLIGARVALASVDVSGIGAEIVIEHALVVSGGQTKVTRTISGSVVGDRLTVTSYYGRDGVEFLVAPTGTVVSVECPGGVFMSGVVHRFGSEIVKEMASLIRIRWWVECDEIRPIARTQNLVVSPPCAHTT